MKYRIIETEWRGGLVRKLLQILPSTKENISVRVGFDDEARL